MKFLITMDMAPLQSDYSSHQVTVEHPSRTLAEFCDYLNDNAFVLVRLWYYQNNHATGERGWRDRGEMVLNTQNIGKVAAYFENRETRHFE